MKIEARKGRLSGIPRRHVIEAHGLLVHDGLEQHDADFVVQGDTDRGQHERRALPQQRFYDLRVEPETGKSEKTPVCETEARE